ncbi:MAG TPA: DNA polymerase III subunit delta' [Flavobacteriia bacterium]|nr:DNA polymerase III subunit delta' [Flavobacteriia bacterium]
MQFKDIIGLEKIKEYLDKTVASGKIPHAQLFVGAEGSGSLPLAIAYAQKILCKDSKNKDSCFLKCEKLAHPDLHFSFPITTTDSVKKNPTTDLFLTKWREIIKENPYFSLFNWMQLLGVENKQGIINKAEAENIAKKLSVKSFEGGKKIMILWMAEKLHHSAANQLLKLIEEPPENTLFLLITEDEEQIIKTIRSRCQALYIPKMNEENMVNALMQKEGILQNEAVKIAHQANGNYNKALSLLNKDSNDLIYEKWFITWIRAAFLATNPAVIENLIDWSNEIASSGRENQKQFLQYCLQFFRQALLLNYKAKKLVYLETETPNFDLNKFAPYVHGKNIIEINQTINEAIYHIERNGNPKMIFLDISMKLTKLLHTKE